jgi:hypothetical protein
VLLITLAVSHAETKCEVLALATALTKPMAPVLALVCAVRPAPRLPAAPAAGWPAATHRSIEPPIALEATPVFWKMRSQPLPPVRAAISAERLEESAAVHDAARPERRQSRGDAPRARGAALRRVLRAIEGRGFLPALDLAR